MQPCHSLRFARGASHNLKSHSTKSGRYLSSHLANTTPAVKDVVHVRPRKVQQYAIIASLRSELMNALQTVTRFLSSQGRKSQKIISLLPKYILVRSKSKPCALIDATWAGFTLFTPLHAESMTTPTN